MARSSGSIPSTPAPRRRRGSRRTPIRPGPPALPRRPPRRTACAYALFGNGDIAAFDLAGKQLWARNLGYPDSGYGISASLVAWQGRVIVQYDQAGGKSALIALEGATGEKAWSTPRPVEDSWPSPILIDIGGQKQLVTSARPLTIAYDPATGAELWRTDTSLGADLAPSPAFGGGVVLVCGKPIAQDAKVVAIGAGGSKPGQILWTSTVLAGDVPSPVFTGEGFLVVHSNEGEQIGTLAYYPTQSPTANAKPLWTEAPGKDAPRQPTFYSSPVLADGRVYLFDRNGMCWIFKAGAKYEFVAKCDLGEPCDTTPAILDGRIYIRGQKNLYCIIGAGK